MSESDAWVEYLLRNAELRIEGKPLSDLEAQEAMEWAHACRLEMDEPLEVEDDRND